MVLGWSEQNIPRLSRWADRPKARPLQRPGLRCGLVGFVAVRAGHVKDDLSGLGTFLFGDGGESAEQLVVAWLGIG